MTRILRFRSDEKIGIQFSDEAVIIIKEKDGDEEETRLNKSCPTNSEPEGDDKHPTTIMLADKSVLNDCLQNLAKVNEAIEWIITYGALFLKSESIDYKNWQEFLFKLDTVASNFSNSQIINDLYNEMVGVGIISVKQFLLTSEPNSTLIKCWITDLVTCFEGDNSNYLPQAFALDYCRREKYLTELYYFVDRLEDERLISKIMTMAMS